MQTAIRTVVSLVAFAASTAAAFAQSGLPTTQPNMLVIYRESVKAGHGADHEKTEAGWPAAFEKAKSPDYYIALVSMTGPAEAWFVQPLASNAALGESLKREAADPVLAADLARLSKVDAEHLTGHRVIHARARTDLSIGAFPDTSAQRFFEITTFQLRPGYSGAFAEAVKAYSAAASRAGAPVTFRTYEVVAGMPEPTFLLFSSAAALDAFDAMTSAGDAVMKAASAEERAVLERTMREAVVTVESQRFRLNPTMSYVPRETREKDPGFWLPKPSPRRQTMAAPARTPAAPQP